MKRKTNSAPIPANTAATTAVSPFLRALVWAPWIAFPFFAIQVNTRHPGFTWAIVTMAALALNASIIARVAVLSTGSKPSPLRTALLAGAIAIGAFVGAGLLGHGFRWMVSFRDNPVPPRVNHQIEGPANGYTLLKVVLDGKFSPDLIASPEGGGPKKATTQTFLDLIHAREKGKSLDPLLPAVDQFAPQLTRLAADVRAARQAPSFSWNSSLQGLPAAVQIPRFAPLLQAVRALLADAIRLAHRGDREALDRLDSAAWLALKASEHGTIVGAAIGVAAQRLVNSTAVVVSTRYKTARRFTAQSSDVAAAMAEALPFERATIARYWAEAGILQRAKLTDSYDGFPEAHDTFFPSLGFAQAFDLCRREAQYRDLAGIPQVRDRLVQIADQDTHPTWFRYLDLIDFNAKHLAEKAIEMLDGAPTGTK